MTEIFEKVLLLGAEYILHHTTSTCWYLHQHVEEYKNTTLNGKQFCEKLGLAPKNLSKNSMVLKKSKNNFDCLINEMFLVNDLSLNVQSDSLIAKVFVWAKFCLF